MRVLGRSLNPSGIPATFTRQSKRCCNENANVMYRKHLTHRRLGIVRRKIRCNGCNVLGGFRVRVMAAGPFDGISNGQFKPRVAMTHRMKAEYCTICTMAGLALNCARGEARRWDDRFARGVWNERARRSRHCLSGRGERVFSQPNRHRLKTQVLREWVGRRRDVAGVRGALPLRPEPVVSG